LENSIRLAVDSVFPPPLKSSRSAKCQEAVEQIEGNEDRFTQIYPLEG
jgi:hypothetical protein